MHEGKRPESKKREAFVAEIGNYDIEVQWRREIDGFEETGQSLKIISEGKAFGICGYEFRVKVM